MVAELFAEVGHDIAAHSTTVIIEVVQFFIFLAIVYAVAIGFGKRKGILVGILARREERVSKALQAAAGADERLAAARNEAAQRIAAARHEAAEILSAARHEAAEAKAAMEADVKRQVAEMRARAEETLATELDEMEVELRDRLVELVASATRSILNESYGVSEQRAMIQKAILSGIERMDTAEASRHVLTAEKGGTA